jgi:drug/metabolite transporter (DMT)-like permease
MGSLAVCSLMLLGLGFSASEQKVGLLSRRAAGWALGTAVLDTSGNMLFIAATRAGRLDVAAVLASLYPASTILLAAWTLHEKPTRRQGLGMAIAAVAVVMITL